MKKLYRRPVLRHLGLLRRITHVLSGVGDPDPPRGTPAAAPDPSAAEHDDHGGLHEFGE